LTAAVGLFILVAVLWINDLIVKVDIVHVLHGIMGRIA
jgi:hypothetical protein